MAVTENDFRLTNIFTFDPEIIFSPHFHFKAFPEKEREREREKERARGADLQSDERREIAISRCVDRDLAFDRDRVFAIDGAISRRREIAQLIAISPSTEIAINGAISRHVDREIAPSRARVVYREIAPSRSQSRIAIVDDIFLGFVFSFFFSKYQKIFFGKFFEMQPNTWKYFPFPEISISGKYVFSGKRFTATKHSLRAKTKYLIYIYIYI